MEMQSELLISADSHVIEPSDLWAERVAPAFRNQVPRYPQKSHFQVQEGGTNPVARIKEMATDGVSGEVLYPSLGLNQFGMKDAALQEACFRAYNDWLIEYCAHAPERLFGIGMISTYRIDNAVQEVHRCKQAGMRGVMIWQVPPEELSFATNHYDRFWAAAQDLRMPVSLHVITGMNHTPEGVRPYNGRDAALRFDGSVNMRLLYTLRGLSQIIASGVLERYPLLKIVLVETEVSWLPFVISQWDKYATRYEYDTQMKMLPSEYFARQVFATFFDDPPTRWLFAAWGSDNCMWSNDFPHLNSTWPHSREVIARDLGPLPDAVRAKLVRENVARLFDLPAIMPVATA